MSEAISGAAISEAISSEGSQPRVKLRDASNGMDGRRDIEMDVENNTYKESLVSVKQIRFMENLRSTGGNKEKLVKGKANNGEVNLTHQQYGKNSTQLLSEVTNQAQFKSNAINGPLTVPIGRSLCYSPKAMNISIGALEVGKKRFRTGKGLRAKGVLTEGIESYSDLIEYPRDPRNFSKFSENLVSVNSAHWGANRVSDTGHGVPSSRGTSPNLTQKSAVIYTQKPSAKTHSVLIQVLNNRDYEVLNYIFSCKESNL
ncbi:hypothetical protein Sjap_001544 [Stephania japonica]|uniref:Uncharacterized protein n=1 Tax=Stephania japonica TaxID=461633 RepID=A0AAP0KMF8_9MAGN